MYLNKFRYILFLLFISPYLGSPIAFDTGSLAIAPSLLVHLPLIDISAFYEKISYRQLFLLTLIDEIKSQKRVHYKRTLDTSYYVGYPIFSQLKYPLFMFCTFTSIPYLFRNNCASIGRSRETPMGDIGETILV